MSELEKAQRRIAALERTVARHVKWHDDAIAAAKLILYSEDAFGHAHGAAWWDGQINKPQVVLSDESPPSTVLAGL